MKFWRSGLLAVAAAVVLSAQEKTTFSVSMRDGVRLATDVYGADTKVSKPVLLQRTPYNKDNSAAVARRYAAAGYVSVVQDARGAFASQGQYFHHNNDDQDGYDTIEWLTHQLWSNGKVGMWGGSHPGAVQWLAAADRPPGLVVLAPTAASPSLYYTAYVGGALRLALIGGAGPLITKPPSGKSVPPNLIEFYRTRPLTRLDEAIGWEMPWMRGVLEHPWLDGFWSRQHATERTRGLDIAAQHIVGYYDFLCRETVASFQRMRKDSVTERSRHGQQLILGPWDHSTGRTTVLTGSELDFGKEAALDVVEENRQWFDRFLKDSGNSMDFPPVRYFVLGRNEWRKAGNWPPPESVDRSLYLRSSGNANTRAGDGRLNGTPQAKSSIAEFIVDPADPVPADPPGVSPMPRSSMFRPIDRRRIQDRPDVLVYTAAPQTQELIVAGNPRAELYASVDAEDADFAVKLLDVTPNGPAYPVAEGVLRLTHREGDLRSSRVVPGTIYRITVDLGHTAFALAAGHALQLEIAGSYFPVYDRNSHAEEGPFARRESSAKQKIHHSPGHPSRLILPILRTR